MSGRSTMASFNMNHFNALTKDLTQIKALYITLYYVCYISVLYNLQIRIILQLLSQYKIFICIFKKKIYFLL